VGVCAIAKQQQWLLEMSAKGQQPLHRTACIAVGLFICQNTTSKMCALKCFSGGREKRLLAPLLTVSYRQSSCYLTLAPWRKLE